MTNKDLKVHPLHTLERITEHIKTTGEYIGDHRTGRSTSQALRLLGDVMKQPYTWLNIMDHAAGGLGINSANMHLMKLIKEIIIKLAFEHFEIDERNMRIRFGKDPSTPAYVR